MGNKQQNRDTLAGKEWDVRKEGRSTAIILACIPAGSLLTPTATALPPDPELEGGRPAKTPPADLAACTVASGEVLPLD